MRRPTTLGSPVREGDLLADLSAVYREAEQVFSGWTCEASTECCRFGITGREPYVTSIELAAVQRAIAARGGHRALQGIVRADGVGAPAPTASASEPRLRRALPQASERRCPMLTDAGRCAIYAARPLGCRTFFCDRASAGSAVRHHDVTRLVRKVQEIAAKHAAGGDLGRPLTRALAEAGPSSAGAPPRTSGAARARRGR
ncbi:YkgJ family cysteine cluster protein [Sorangium sp. So ce1000]|uniref:YkgJ family cysteine cluster protein n=1 Tax=Sorangium sp. So ce1000 TaxID=3133325 RepID=UPI003F630085